MTRKLSGQDGDAAMVSVVAHDEAKRTWPPRVCFVASVRFEMARRRGSQTAAQVCDGGYDVVTVPAAMWLQGFDVLRRVIPTGYTANIQYFCYSVY